MKKLVCVLVALAVVVGLASFLPSKAEAADYLRLQVYANSNSALDQGVKYIVKDKLVEYLTPILSKATDKDNAIKIVTDINFNLIDVCKKVLSENSIKYSAKIKIENEDKLVVELGAASGEEESCTIYPPLNFKKQDVKFKSKIFNWLKSVF